MAMTKSNRAILKAAANLVRHPYAWPGGYPMYAITSDGTALSAATIKKEWRHIVDAHINNDTRSGWHIAAIDINWEDGELRDDHTNERIESAYAD